MNRNRITPAHAGTSPLNVAKVLLGQDHPRTRGDKFDKYPPMTIYVGSPPHTRGQVAYAIALSRKTRITPAHAGTSLKSSLHIKQVKDHPRTRGDK